MNYVNDLVSDSKENVTIVTTDSTATSSVNTTTKTIANPSFETNANPTTDVTNVNHIETIENPSEEPFGISTADEVFFGEDRMKKRKFMEIVRDNVRERKGRKLYHLICARYQQKHISDLALNVMVLANTRIEKM